MASAEDARRRQEIQSSLESIVETSDRWLGRLRTRESRVRLASSFLTTVLVFLVVGGGLAGFLVSQGKFQTLLQHPMLAISVAGAILLSGIVGGFVTYFLLKKRHEAQLKELSSLIIEMKKKMAEEQKTSSAGGEGITEDALSLADKIVKLLPEMVRKRNQDSLLFGVVAFILALFTGNFAVAVLVGVIVWIYFRYEFGKTYEQEISKLEEQKKVFEQRKKDFIETL